MDPKKPEPDLSAYDEYLPTSDLGGATVTSSWMAVGALFAAAVGPFTCYSTYLVALPLALVACWQAWKAATAPESRALDAATAARSLKSVSYANLAGGAVAAMMSFFLIAIFALVIFVYAAIFFVAILGAAAQG